MYMIRYFICLGILLLSLSCNNTAEKSEDDIVYVNEEELIKSDVETDTDTATINIDKETPQTVSSAETLVVIEQEKDDSVFKGSECEEIMKEYMQVVKRILNSEEDQAALLKFGDDINFTECKGHKDYKEEYDKVQEQLNNLLADDY